VRSPSYLGPCWRSIDLARPDLVCTGVGLLEAETVLLGRESRQSGSSHAFWRLQPDPGRCVATVVICVLNLLT
jgi:hypothetical protein